MAKKENDTKAIIESQMKKEVATSSHVLETEGVKELMEAGAIHEAAVVFSHAGMGAFATMFGNSMETAVERVLKERMDHILNPWLLKVSSIVESKMVEMLEGMTAGMNSFAITAGATSKADITAFKEKYEEVQKTAPAPKIEVPDELSFNLNTLFTPTDEPKSSTSLLEEIPASVRAEVVDRIAENTKQFEKFLSTSQEILPSREKTTKPVNPGIAAMQRAREENDALPDPQYSEIVFDRTVIDLRALPKSTGRLGTSKANVAIMKPYIMAIFKLNAGKDIKSMDILRVLREEYNVVMNNATIVMQKLIQQEPSIQKTAFGIYRYEEKTFRPIN